MNIERFIEARKALVLSQMELAEGICTQATLSRFENNGQVPNLKILIKLCNRLNLPLGELFPKVGVKYTEATEKMNKAEILVIDEVLALSEGVNKQIKESFMSLLSTIALLGRATNCHLILVSQRFDFNAVPVSVREQCNLLIQIGNINSKTIQFLFPDLNPEGIVIPLGKGTGLVQVIDSEQPYNILPLLTPTFYTEEGIV